MPSRTTIATATRLTPATRLTAALIAFASTLAIATVMGGTAAAQAKEVRIVNPCPWNFSQTQVVDPFENLSVLERNLGAVQQYVNGPGTPPSATVPAGTTPPAEFGQAGMGWVGTQHVVILEVVGAQERQIFHAEQLRTRVPNPELVVLCGIAISYARYQAITNEIYLGPLSRHPEFYGHERAPDGRAVLKIGGGAEAFGNDLLARYGSDVTLRRGFLDYPAAQFPNRTTPVRCTKPVPVSSSAGKAGSKKAANPAAPTLTWKAPKTITFKQGGRTSIKVTVTNNGPKAIQLDALEAIVTTQGGRMPVALDAREVARLAIALPGLAPKESKTFDVRIVGDSCVAANGYSLRPGKYSVYVVADNGASVPGAVSVPPSPALSLVVTP
jgi:hypothetical protein